MSAETRKSAEEATKHLQSAEQSLKQAGESARKSGDGSVVKRIEKLGGEVAETRQDIQKKLGSPKEGA
jgi:DNA anti-recombination protein RmuC